RRPGSDRRNRRPIFRPAAGPPPAAPRPEAPMPQPIRPILTSSCLFPPSSAFGRLCAAPRLQRCAKLGPLGSAVDFPRAASVVTSSRAGLEATQKPAGRLASFDAGLILVGV